MCPVDYVLPVTHVLAERVKQVGVPDAKIVVIPNGIDLEHFSEIPAIDDAKAALGSLGETVLNKLSKSERAGWEWLASKGKAKSSEMRTG